MVVIRLVVLHSLASAKFYELQKIGAPFGALIFVLWQLIDVVEYAKKRGSYELSTTFTFM